MSIIATPYDAAAVKSGAIKLAPQFSPPPTAGPVTSPDSRRSSIAQEYLGEVVEQTKSLSE